LNCERRISLFWELSSITIIPTEMKNFPSLTLTAFLFASMIQAGAHTVADNGITSLEENRRPLERVLLQIPDIGGFVTLKCDLHMHTVFSDGLVWPTTRVQEAWFEGLDAICITDHIEYQPHKKDIPTNHNRSYEIARGSAKMGNILLVKGSELTRDTPPGHFNAIFIGDASDYLEEKGSLELDKKAIEKAAAQDAFIFWNHPGWKASSIEGSYEWIPFVDELKKAGNLHGIEVINGFRFHRKALDWALENDLTVMGSSDVHNSIDYDYDMQKGVHRSMTLVFAKDRSAEGIREALDQRRTVAWSTKLLAGSEKWVRALYEGSVTVGKAYSTDKRGTSYAEITNTSDFYFELQRMDPDQEDWPENISLNPQTSRVLKFKADPKTKSVSYKVTNAYIGGDRNLVVEISN